MRLLLGKPVKKASIPVMGSRWEWELWRHVAGVAGVKARHLVEEAIDAPLPQGALTHPSEFSTRWAGLDLVLPALGDSLC